MSSGGSDSRVTAYLAELQRQVDSALRHVNTMQRALDESATWESPEDRDWIRGAHDEALRAHRAAEKRLRHALAEKVMVR